VLRSTRWGWSFRTWLKSPHSIFRDTQNPARTERRTSLRSPHQLSSSCARPCRPRLPATRASCGSGCPCLGLGPGGGLGRWSFLVTPYSSEPDCQDNLQSEPQPHPGQTRTPVAAAVLQWVTACKSLGEAAAGGQERAPRPCEEWHGGAARVPEHKQHPQEAWMGQGGVSPRPPPRTAVQSRHAGQGTGGGSTLSLVVDVLPLHRLPDHVVKKIVVRSHPANTSAGRFGGAPHRAHRADPARLLPVARHQPPAQRTTAWIPLRLPACQPAAREVRDGIRRRINPQARVPKDRCCPPPRCPVGLTGARG